MRTTQPESADAHSDLAALRAHITELEHALTVERAQRVYYDQILSNVNDAIIVVDLSFRIHSWNAAAERMYGWSVGEVLNQPMNMLLRTTYLDTFNAQT